MTDQDMEDWIMWRLENEEPITYMALLEQMAPDGSDPLWAHRCRCVLTRMTSRDRVLICPDRTLVRNRTPRFTTYR